MPISELDLRSSCAACFDALRQRNVARARHQQAERDRLRIAVGKLRIVGLRKQQLAPVLGEAGQPRAAARHLLDDLVAQQPAQAGADLARAAWRLAAGLAPIAGSRLISGSNASGALSLAPDVSTSPSSWTISPCELAVAPQAECIAVGVDQVRQRLELVPLLLVVRIAELARVGAFARRLDLDEANQGFADRDRDNPAGSSDRLASSRRQDGRRRQTIPRLRRGPG